MPEKEPYVIQRLPTQLYLISPLDVGGSFPDRLARALDAGPVAVPGGTVSLVEVYPTRRADTTYYPDEFRFGFRIGR